MPYIPRNLAPLSVPDLSKVPKEPKVKAAVISATPINRPNQESSSRKTNPFMGKLNMYDWQMPVTRVYKNLTGKELVTDEHNGLVSRA